MKAMDRLASHVLERLYNLAGLHPSHLGLVKIPAVDKNVEHIAQSLRAGDDRVQIQGEENAFPLQTARAQLAIDILDRSQLV
jgi:hypothetical protein